SGDPLGSAGAGGDFPVSGHGVFHHHIGSAGGNKMKEYRIQPVAGFSHKIFLHRYPGLPQNGGPFAGNLWVGISGADDHPGDFLLQNRFRAGRSSPVMTAGFQSHIQSSSLGRLPQRTDGIALRVEFSPSGMPALPDDPAVLYNNRSYQRIGIGPTP